MYNPPLLAQHKGLVDLLRDLCWTTHKWWSKSWWNHDVRPIILSYTLTWDFDHNHQDWTKFLQHIFWIEQHKSPPSDDIKSYCTPKSNRNDETYLPRALPSSSEGWLQNKFLIKVRQDDSNWKDGVWPMSATIVPTADGQRTVAFQQPVAQIWIVGHSLQVAWFNCEWCLPRFLKHQQYFLHV